MIKMNIRTTLLTALMLFVLSITLITVLKVGSAYAAPAEDACAGLVAMGATCDDSSGKVNSLVKTIITVLSLVVGVVSVIMIIIGGIKYVISSGDPNNVTSAKNTILYAIVGLVVAVMAQAIVAFVLKKM